jgi:outer membrane protein
VTIGATDDVTNGVKDRLSGTASSGRDDKAGAVPRLQAALFAGVVAWAAGVRGVARAEEPSPQEATKATPSEAPSGRGGLPSQLTVAAAVAFAREHNPRLAAGRARVQAEEARATSQGRRLLPAVRLSDEWQAWDSAYSIAAGPSVFPIRDQFTNTFTAGFDQPVVGLLHLNEEQAAAHASALAAAEQTNAGAADLAETIALQFLRYFEAGALKSIAESSMRELEEQIVVAKARLAQGVITQADLLRIEVAAANSRQQAIQAESQIVGTRAAIFGLLGIPDDRQITLVEPKDLLQEARSAEAPQEALIARAAERRAELKQALHLKEAADHQRAARTYALLPDIDLEGAYLRTDGQKFAPPNAAFVGVKAQWAIWEWGASTQLRRAAVAQTVAAESDAEAWRRQIETEIVTGLAQSEAARGAVQAADAAIASAEEAYRVTNAQVKSGTATTTDLLQAEAALTQARLNQTRATYELALARVSLRRATGD